MTRPAPQLLPRHLLVANVMELFERAAYYGMNSVLAVYLALRWPREDSASASRRSASSEHRLCGDLRAADPGGALADRYGYRRMLLVAFSCSPPATSAGHAST